MFEKLTDQAKQVMELANREAQYWSREVVGVDHLFLALCRSETGLAAKILRQLGLDLKQTRLEMGKMMKSGQGETMGGELPLGEEVEKTFEHATKHARKLGHPYIGTEHLLLGLFSQRALLPGRFLTSRGITRAKVKKELAISIAAERASVVRGG